MLHIIAAAIKPLSEGKLKIFGLESVKMKILVGSLPFFQAAPNKRPGFFFSYICLQIPPPGVSSFMEMLVALLLFLQAAPTIRSQTTPPPVEDNNDLWALVGAFYQQNIGHCH